MKTETQDPAKAWNVTGDFFATLYPTKKSKLCSVLVAIHYKESPVGPYLEVAYLPGRIEFEKQDYWTVANMIVNSEKSEYWGRKNWSFPKITLPIQLNQYKSDYQFIVESEAGKIQLDYRNTGILLPVKLNMIPVNYRKLVQFQDDTAYISQLNLSGKLKFARLRNLEITMDGFPNLNGLRSLGSFCILDFKETIPEAEVKKCSTIS